MTVGSFSMRATAIFETKCPAVTRAGMFFWRRVGAVRFFGVFGRFGGLRLLWGVGYSRALSWGGVGIFHRIYLSADGAVPISGSHCLGVE